MNLGQARVVRVVGRHGMAPEDGSQAENSREQAK